MKGTMITFLAVLAVGNALAATPAVARHNFLAQFDAKKPVALRGTIARMEWGSPHGWFYIDVTRGDGEVERWAVETDNPARMQAQGRKGDDFRAGTEVLVAGFGSRSGSTETGLTIAFPDRQAIFLLGQ